MINKLSFSIFFLDNINILTLVWKYNKSACNTNIVPLRHEALFCLPPLYVFLHKSAVNNNLYNNMSNICSISKIWRKKNNFVLFLHIYLINMVQDFFHFLYVTLFFHHTHSEMVKNNDMCIFVLFGRQTFCHFWYGKVV